MDTSDPDIADLKRRFQLDLVPYFAAPVTAGTHPDEADLIRAMGKEMISLLCLRGPLLLVPAPTGIVYSCQVGGYGCLAKWMEGFLIPLSSKEKEPAIFHRLDMWDWNDQDPRFLSDVSDQIGGNQGCNVQDLEIVKDDDNTEAWVWARFKINDRPQLGVVTWQNSD